MYPLWLVRSLEAVQSVFSLPSGTILGVEVDTVVHFLLIMSIVALAVERGRTRLGLGVAAALALVKEALDLSILVHYRDVRPNFVLDVAMDLLAAAVAMGVGVVIARALLARRSKAP